MKPYRDVHFSMALLDAAAFHQILTTFIFYLPNMRPCQQSEEYERGEAFYHHSHAISLINQRISDQEYATSVGLIAAVVGLVCHAVSYPCPKIVSSITYGRLSILYKITRLAIHI
jgi:hypothetical protein